MTEREIDLTDQTGYTPARPKAQAGKTGRELDRPWHRGDRALHTPSGQHGIVQGWKGEKILLLWGVANTRLYQDFVLASECVREADPAVEVVGTR